MSKNNAVSLEAYDNFRDPLAELAREADCWRWRPRSASCSPAATGSKGRTAAGRWCEAAISRSATFRPARGRSRCGSPRPDPAPASW